MYLRFGIMEIFLILLVAVNLFSFALLLLCHIYRKPVYGDEKLYNRVHRKLILAFWRRCVSYSPFDDQAPEQIIETVEKDEEKINAKEEKEETKDVMPNDDAPSLRVITIHVFKQGTL